jgi:2'-5' RNA ligase
MLQRLFIAIDLPSNVRQALRAFKVEQYAVRAVAEDNIHLTLYFPGSAETALVIDLLTRFELTSRPFELQIKGVGYFVGRGGNLILWAGVEPNSQLSVLHSELTACLMAAGFEVERRPYHPHITLARGLRIAKSSIEQFMLENGEFRASAPVNGISLYSSETTQSGPVYTVVHQRLLT